MSSKLRRRMMMAAGACIAGAAMPIATAFSAWADDIEITYDGKIVFDNFTGAPAAGASDVGTAAESGTNNDWAIVEAPAADGNILLANDSAGSDSGDYAFYQGDTTPVTVYGQEGATIVNGTNSDAEVYGGGTASINMAVNGVEDPVSNSTALATNGGFADVSNDGLAPTGVTVAGDYADANGTAAGTLANDTAGTTPSVANIYDSGSSAAFANDTGTNEVSGEGGAAVDLANNSDAYAVNPGSGADIIGTATTPVVNSTNVEPDGDIFAVLTSGTNVIDGIPDTTFFADLFGADGATAMSADWTILLQAFGL
jgi:hypothetical protein